jgi:hypothetical protein
MFGHSVASQYLAFLAKCPRLAFLGTPQNSCSIRRVYTSSNSAGMSHLTLIKSKAKKLKQVSQKALAVFLRKGDNAAPINASKCACSSSVCPSTEFLHIVCLVFLLFSM